MLSSDIVRRSITVRFSIAAATLAVAFTFGPNASAQSAKSGKALFEECVVCHTVAGDAKPDEGAVGPSLHGVFGRKAGGRDDFRYSGPMKRSAVVWSRETLDQFIANPQGAVPGNRMPYSGMAEVADRRALIDYLEQATK